MIPDSFKSSLTAEYPIPFDLSIWYSNPDLGADAMYDLEDLILTAMREVEGEIQITEYENAVGMTTPLPSDTIQVKSASFNIPFQGTKLVKFSYDPSTTTCYLRFCPAKICFSRRLRVEDLGSSVTTDEVTPEWGDPTKGEDPKRKYPRHRTVTLPSKLKGNQYLYFKNYVLYKMATVELQVMKGVSLTVDNGSIDYSVLSDFASRKGEWLKETKTEILMYSSNFN